VVRRGGNAAGLGWCRGKGTDLTCGPRVSVREEREGESGGRHNPEGKAHSTKYAKAHGLHGLAWEAAAYGEGWADTG
jgi:hypothetical protein